MSIQMRHYRDASDYWRARAFFRELHKLDDRPGGNWHVAHFDYWRWHWLENVVERCPDELCLWETDEGRIAAILNQGDPGVCHIQLHPEFRTARLLDEMAATAEREYVATYDGRRVIWIWTMKDEDDLHEVLAARGFSEQPEGGHSVETHGRRSLVGPIPPVPLREGFTIRSMGDLDELPKRSLASWRSFHPDESDFGCDKTGSWYRNVQRAPLYRRDLDLVAVAPNGDIASFSLCFFDDVSQTGVFVLDGTARQYQRLGLCKAAMTEALRRLQWLGAETAYVAWYEAPAGALYESVGFLEQRIGRVWVKWV
jgi:mycothiol synthase